MGLPRPLRLTRSADVRAVLDGGQSVGSRLLVLYWRENGSRSVRVAVIAGRSLGRAVRRNRARRRLREALRRHLHRIRPGVDLVCIARAPLLSARWEDVEQVLGRLLERAGLCFSRQESGLGASPAGAAREAEGEPPCSPRPG